MTGQEAPGSESGSQTAIEPAGFRARSGDPRRVCLPCFGRSCALRLCDIFKIEIKIWPRLAPCGHAGCFRSSASATRKFSCHNLLVPSVSGKLGDAGGICRISPSCVVAPGRRSESCSQHPPPHTRPAPCPSPPPSPPLAPGAPLLCAACWHPARRYHALR